MKLTGSDFENLRETAVDASRCAAELIQKKAGAGMAVLSKSGGDSLASQVLTEVDLASQELILRKLEHSINRYDLGLLSEESADDSSRHQRDWFWCIDPLDGTLPFTENQSGYSVSIALVSREGIPAVGVVAEPRTGIIYHALKGSGAFRNNEPFSLSPLPENAKLTWLMDRSFRKIADFSRLQKTIETFAGDRGFSEVSIIDHGGAAMNALWVLENSPALYFKFPKPEEGGGSFWDFAATACIFSELEIPPTTIEGFPLDLNRAGSCFMNRGGVVYASSLDLAKLAQDCYQSS